MNAVGSEGWWGVGGEGGGHKVPAEQRASSRERARILPVAVLDGSQEQNSNITIQSIQAVVLDEAENLLFSDQAAHRQTCYGLIQQHVPLAYTASSDHSG